MTLGTALLIIAVLYLVDRHGLWKRAAQVMGGLALLIAIVAGGWFGISEYKTGRMNRDIKTAQGLGLCTTVIPNPLAEFGGIAIDPDRGWVPVLTPDNELRCVDADKVNLEVPPNGQNRIVLSQKDTTIWETSVNCTTNCRKAPDTLPANFDFGEPVPYARCVSPDGKHLIPCTADGKGGVLNR